MKSVSVIDKAFEMSEQNKMIKDILSTNSMQQAKEFKEQYIFPLLKKNNMTMPNDDFIIEETKKLNDYTLGFIKRWYDGYIRKDLENKYNYLNYKKMTPDMTKHSSKVFDIDDKDKIILSTVYVEFIQKLSTFEDKCNNYIKEYIVPILEKEKKIIFDLKSNDEHIKLITDNTYNLFLKYIHEHGSMAFHNEIFSDFTKEDLENGIASYMYKYYNFIFFNDEEINNVIAKGLCETFINNYEQIDLTKKPSSNIRWLYLFIPNELFDFEEE